MCWHFKDFRALGLRSLELRDGGSGLSRSVGWGAEVGTADFHRVTCGLALGSEKSKRLRETSWHSSRLQLQMSHSLNSLKGLYRRLYRGLLLANYRGY